MSKVIRNLCLYPFLLMLAGCAINTPYVVDPNGPHAKLGVKDFKIFGNNSVMRIIADNKTCSGGQTVPPLTKSVTINANRPLTFLLIHTISYNRLVYPATFVPRAGHVYQLSTTSRKRKGFKITTTLQILDKVGEKYKRVPFVARKYAVNEGNCLDSKTDFSKAPKIYSLSRTAKNVPPILILLEKTEN